LITIVNAKKQRDSRQETRRLYVDLVLGFFSDAALEVRVYNSSRRKELV
jgi:hypothetical protein